MGSFEGNALAAGVAAIVWIVQRLLEPRFVTWLSRRIARDLGDSPAPRSYQDALQATAAASSYAQNWSLTQFCVRLAVLTGTLGLLSDLRLHLAAPVVGLLPPTDEPAITGLPMPLFFVWLWLGNLMAFWDRRLSDRAFRLAAPLAPSALEVSRQLGLPESRQRPRIGLWAAIVLFEFVATNRITWLMPDRVLDSRWYAPWGITHRYSTATTICLASRSEQGRESGRLQNRIEPVPAVGIRFADGTYWTTAVYARWGAETEQIVRAVADNASKQSGVAITPVETVYRDGSAKTEQWRVRRGFAPSPCAAHPS